jgi:threonine/homoserine efflux transporter RhtA
MAGSKRILPLVVLLFITGIVALSRFSHNVRSVDVVGLSGAGFALGVGFTFLVLGLQGRIRNHAEPR